MSAGSPTSDHRCAIPHGSLLGCSLIRLPQVTLEQYLKNYPDDRPARVRETLFWSEDDLPGLKPTLSITREMVYAALGTPPRQWRVEPRHLHKERSGSVGAAVGA